ncbi:hypothetical protein CDV36_013538 [Fusarium kuroshium]|uniref:Uncharacterized protein n=1 Tax=Fusarium kuroshium TaxID=2010991 RepID=A0A3M2RNF0_9HYPO|nr:hypothetical protein CDV36_013538 [Fusarium kuroshium]
MGRKRDKVKSWFGGGTTLKPPDATEYGSESSLSASQSAHSPVTATTQPAKTGAAHSSRPLSRPPSPYAPPAPGEQVSRPGNRTTPTHQLPNLNATRPSTHQTKKALWVRAFETLPEETRIALIRTTGTVQPPEQIQEQIQQLALEKQRQAEAKTWKFRFNGRHVILRDVAGKIIVWLDKMKGVGDVAVSFDPVHGALPWAAVRFVLQAATVDSQQHGQLLVGMEQVTYLLLRCAVYETMYTKADALASDQSAQNFETALIQLYASILSFMALYIRLISKRTTRRAMHALFNVDELGQYMGNLQSLESRVEVEFSIFERVYQRQLHHNLAGRYGELQGVLTSQLLRLGADVKNLWTRQDKEKNAEILQWLSSIPHLSDHDAARAGRVHGTGEWLLRHQVYNDWWNTSASMVLWLHGIPGCGKTKLSSKVIDGLMDLGSSNLDSEGLAYFYCDRNQEDHQQPTRVLQSLVRQLATKTTKELIMSFIVDLYDQRKSTGFAMSQLTVLECRDLAVKMLSRYSQTTIVIDGLDECNKETRYILMDALEEFLNSSSHPVKIFIASRNDTDLKARYESGQHLEIQATDNQQDIEQFIEDKLDKSPQFRSKISSQTQTKIVSTFKTKSQAMFQWAALHIDDLLKLRRDQDVLQYLDDLPEGLKNAYDKIYHDIKSRKGSWGRVADRAFQWLMGSYRPLRPDELVAAACQDPDTTTVFGVDIDIDFVLDACHNLITVVETDAFDDGSGSVRHAKVCRFAHLSVQEYFETHHWSRKQVNRAMASVCLAVLLESAANDRLDGSSRASQGSQPDKVERELPFGPGPLINYAQGWFVHVRIAEAGDAELYYSDTHLYDLVDIFSADHAEYWIRSFGFFSFIIPLENKSVDLRKVSYDIRRDPLVLFAALGLAGYLKAIFEDDASLFGRLMEEKEEMLSLGVKYGHYDLCKLILDAGAKVHVNTSGTRLRSSPIQIAAYDGRSDLVGLLLANGADVNCHRGLSDSPLLAAASGQGSSETAALLLDAGADINICSLRDGSALQCAAYMEHQDMVKLLISRGADLDLEGGFWGIPIIAAVLGKSSALELLLKAGADVNKVAGFYGTALQMAVYYRFSTMIELLLDQGADPNIRGGYFGSALEAASWLGESLGYPMMKTLLDHGAIVYPSGDYGPHLYKFLTEIDSPEDRKKRGDYSPLEPWKSLSPRFTDHVHKGLQQMNTHYSRSQWHELLSETRGRVAGLPPEGDSGFKPPPID